MKPFFLLFRCFIMLITASCLIVTVAGVVICSPCSIFISSISYITIRIAGVVLISMILIVHKIASLMFLFFFSVYFLFILRILACFCVYYVKKCSRVCDECLYFVLKELGMITILYNIQPPLFQCQGLSGSKLSEKGIGIGRNRCRFAFLAQLHLLQASVPANFCV